MPTRSRVVLALALLAASCRSMTPLEIALYERTQGQFFLLARDPEVVYAQLGRPDVVRPDGQWVYYEWRLAGWVYEKIKAVPVEGHERSPFRYRYVPASPDAELSRCVVRVWVKAEGNSTHMRERIGPDNGVCLQLLDERYRAQQLLLRR